MMMMMMMLMMMMMMMMMMMVVIRGVCAAYRPQGGQGTRARRDC
jgi:hypothetical protein